MQLLFPPDGSVICLYDELMDLSTLGKRHICRASYVEPDADGQWHVNLAPSNGPQLGPFPCRSAALQAERAWLEAESAPECSSGLLLWKFNHIHFRSLIRMRILFINNDGGGFADDIEVEEGTTVQKLFAQRMHNGNPANYLIRVNRQPAAAEQLLQESDRVSITPTKIEGAA
jgi:hypothetical protein